MNRLAFTLALTTVLFASTTVYFAHAFQAERARAANPPRVRVVEKTVISSATPVDQATPAAAVPAGPPPGTYVRNRAAEIAFSRARLKRLTDPEGRAEQLANLTAMTRSNYYAVGRGAGWTRDEIDRVAAVLAERSLQRMEMRFRCDVTPNCTTPPLSDAEKKEADHLELVQLLGEAKVARFDRFLATTAERTTVEFMRLRLSDGGPLSDAQTERFISAIAEENRRFTEGAKARGTEVRISMYGYGSATLPVEGDLKTAAGRLRAIESATEYARNLHDRAAQILTPAQLASFDEMQEETLRSVRESVRLQEIGEAAR